MDIQGFFCPKCKKELNSKLSGRGRIIATCEDCGIILFMEDLENWKLRQKRFQQMRQTMSPSSFSLKKYYSSLLDDKYFKSKKKEKKKKKKDFNPSKR